MATGNGTDMNAAETILPAYDEIQSHLAQRINNYHWQDYEHSWYKLLA